MSVAAECVSDGFYGLGEETPLAIVSFLLGYLVLRVARVMSPQTPWLAGVAPAASRQQLKGVDFDEFEPYKCPSKPVDMNCQTHAATARAGRQTSRGGLDGVQGKMMSGADQQIVIPGRKPC
eukprot:gb/GFBE01022883.1/.p1 GENE.gb/GFBE01022883.1/~~gb/GFBE01022883.1/.p1  ORF type:complete len:122 (+),score=26.29 gb/GFBE01022883.1/:1-366(+)